MNWLRKFMYGRYGADQLSIAIMFIYFIGTFISQALNNVVFSLILLIFPVILLVRMLSKNIAKRRQENAVFLKFWGPIQFWFTGKIKRAKESKTHKFLKCPKCSKTLRVPKGKGTICVTCPVCKTQFNKKT